MNYEDFDGLGLADLVKCKEVSALELVEAAIAQSALFLQPYPASVLSRNGKSAFVLPRSLRIDW